MNKDLYTEEFRNFKYLKSSASAVTYYKMSAHQINDLQPWAQAHDPSFVWPCRLEFVEQILDLRDKNIYLVLPGDLYGVDASMKSYDYKESSCIEIINPVIYRGHVLSPDITKVATTDDVNDMEADGREFCLCSSSYLFDIPTAPKLIFDLGGLPIVPGNVITYTAMFYDGGIAKKYAKALTDSLRNNTDAISAISRLF